MKINKKAHFITFEGGEGSGKSTQIGKLSKVLTEKGYKLKIFHEPGSTPLGEKVREILLDKKESITHRAELFLYLSARAQFVEKELIPALQQSQIILCDRFSDSTLVYQGKGLGLGVNKIRPFMDFAAHNIEPDLTLILNINPEQGLKRIKNRSRDRIEQRPLAFHKKLQSGYSQLKKTHPRRIHIIKVRGINDTHKEILKVVETHVKRFRKNS